MAKSPGGGEQAPDLELPGTNGPFRLSEHRGERVVLARVGAPEHILAGPRADRRGRSVAECGGGLALTARALLAGVPGVQLRELKLQAARPFPRLR